MPDDHPVRVRFAPSPTGDPHIGSLWVAFFDYLFARQHDGTFVLRIEDTDQQRFVPGTVEKIYEALAWYGIEPDEGPQQGGPFGPYVQSQRLARYRQHAVELLGRGSAYYCFCTAERLTALRHEQALRKQPPRYDRHCADLTPSEAEQRVAKGESAVVRLRLPMTGQIVHDDLIRGRVTFRFDQLDDSVLLKSDGFPTYHLAVVVDDHLMEISHVIRAEEWLPSVPKHLFLHQAFGWKPPVFAHLPQLLGNDKKKLSKRHGAASALAFRDEGYLPEAMRNFLALMGWHPKGEEEVLSLEEIQAQFRLEAVNPSGAIFDQAKLDWINGRYIRTIALDDLFRRVKPHWDRPAGEHVDDDWLTAGLALIRDRMKTLRDVNMINFGFASVWNREFRSLDRSIIVPKRGSREDALAELQWAQARLAETSAPWTSSELRSQFLAAIASSGKKNLGVLWPLRAALSLRAASPDVFDLLAWLGPKESQRRLAAWIES